MRLLNSFLYAIKKVFHQNKQLNMLFFLFYDWFFINLKIGKIFKNKKIAVTLHLEWYRRLFYNNKHALILDIIFFKLSMALTLFKNNFKSNTIFFKKLKQIYNNGFYLTYSKINIPFNNKLYLYGTKSVWGHIRFWILPLLVVTIFIYYSFFLKSLPFSKLFISNLLIINMFYLLFSGFVFFIKKYKNRFYTGAIQRFWRRSLFIFWFIECSLFLIFIYLIFNASQEPVYVYDNSQIYKTHFYSWRCFLPKVFLSLTLIIMVYTSLLTIKWSTFLKINNISLVITTLLLYISWLEFYQLFYLMCCYGTPSWVYDFPEHLWNLELEFKRTRIVNHYVTIGLVAKFWHIIFGVVFWIFFLLRCLESSRNRYPLLAANLQNFIIIYVMSWLYMYPWFKYVFRKVLDMPYFWFFINNRKLSIFLLFNDIKLYFWGFVNSIQRLFYFSFFFQNSTYFYWYSSSKLNNTQFRKHNIKDFILITL